MSQRGDRESAILSAVHELLGEVGYERLTIDAVAARARSSKSTIYGRWPDKASLVAATVLARSVHYDGPAYTGEDLFDDVHSFLKVCLLMAENESLTTFTSILLAAPNEPVLADVVRNIALLPRRRDCDEIVTRARERGDAVRDDASSILFDAVLGKILVKYVVVGSVFEPDEESTFVDLVVAQLVAVGAR